MKVLLMRRRSRGEVIANFLRSGMSYLNAVRKYDRLDRADFVRRYNHLYQDDWLSRALDFSSTATI